MRFTKLAVLAVVAPAVSAFMPAVNQRANVFNKHATSGTTTTLSMSLEDDLESKLFSSPAENKKISREAAKTVKAAPTPPAPKAVVPEKLGGISTSDMSYETIGKTVNKKAPPKPKVVAEKKPKLVAEKKVKVVAEKKLKEPPKPKVKEPPKPRFVAEKKVKAPPKPKPVRAPPRKKEAPKPKFSFQKPVSGAPAKKIDPSTVPQGIALGAAPLLLAPVVALAAGRSFLTNTAARRQVIQEGIDEAKALKQKKSTEIDFGEAFKAAVRTQIFLLCCTVL
jgi:hypothetical protein